MYEADYRGVPDLDEADADRYNSLEELEKQKMFRKFQEQVSIRFHFCMDVLTVLGK